MKRANRRVRRGGPARRDAAFDEPLSSDERARLERAVASVSSELGALLERLGEAGARASALERSTGLGRATVHRVLALSKIARGQELAAFAGAPGPEALDAFVEKLPARTLPAKAAGELRLAIAQYRRAIAELGGSHALVKARVAATRVVKDADPDARLRRDRELREQMFRTVAELLNRQTETRLDVMIFRPNDADPDVLDYAQVRGILGHRGRPGAMPLSVDLLGRVRLPDGSPDPALLDLDGNPAGDRLQSTLLEGFSTTPAPIVLSQGLGARVRNVVDPAFVAGGGSADFVVGYQRRAALAHPRTEETPTLEVGALHRDPARHLIVEVWLERTLATEAIADLAAYVWSPTLETSLADHWTDRLPLATTLSVLGTGLGRARSAAWARHDELLAHTFDRLGLDPEHFVGYRAEIDYPLWGGAYFVTFDYGTWRSG